MDSFENEDDRRSEDESEATEESCDGEQLSVKRTKHFSHVSTIHSRTNPNTTG